MPTRILSVCCAAARAYGVQVQAHMASRFRRMTGKGRGWDGERREERGERGVGFAKGIVLPRGKSAVLVCEFVGEDIYMQRQIC